MTQKFPNGFLWGGALSACQAEGAYLEDGKTMTVPEVMPFGKADHKVTRQLNITMQMIEDAQKDADVSKYPKRHGIDFYHTYKSDLELMAGMGFKCFRYSFSWARVFPKGDQEEPNEAALKYYDDLIDTIRGFGMEPIMTISHFDFPLYLLEKYGGWQDRRLIDMYSNYCRVLFERYKGRVKYWITFNEINMSIKAGPKTMGVVNTGQDNYEEILFQSLHHQFVAAAAVTKMAHEIDPNNKVGCMDAYFTAYPNTCKPEDNFAAFQDDHMKNLFYYDNMNGHPYPFYARAYFKKKSIHLEMQADDVQLMQDYPADFIGLSYYNSMISAADESQLELTSGNVSSVYKNPFLSANQWGWQIDPVGLRYTLNHLFDRYSKPLFILENSSGFMDRIENDGSIHDPYRIEFLRAHLSEMKKAVVEDGVDVIGYTMWGPIDIVSSSTSEMTKRYGFIYVDMDDYGNGTGRRIKKDSYEWYREVIASNGADL